jgi:acyl transferase domain-containing protein
MTIDTACSGSLVSVDVACHYLQTRQMEGAIVAASNIYLSPEHNMDMGAMRGASSATGKCHTFDAKADGYIKSEAVNAVMLKRLDDAIRDGDPIRAIIRGTSTNSDGRTPGIASPSSEAQAAAIRAAYANAGITDFNETTYLECHGTGTLAGDPIEVAGASAVFSPTRCADKPLMIGSIKSNLGHSEPAAGISGLLKAILSIEKGIIPGNPTFIDPNPKIDFTNMKVRATRTTIKWPDVQFRRASVNSFGYGGSNAHVVLEEAGQYLKRPLSAQTFSYVSSGDEFFTDDDDDSIRPHLLILSANDEESLKAYCKALSTHLLNPSVSIKLKDLAYTLSERRTKHFHRAYMTTQSIELDEDLFVFGKKSAEAPRVGFVFTGQGAQWSQMGMGLIDNFPAAKLLLQRLDAVLQALPTPPKWSLVNELVETRNPEHLRLPEFSQPLVTALQLAMLEILELWGVKARSVVGHSSGEIAAACAAGYLTPEEAIKIAYFRGLAATGCKDQSSVPVGMLAVGVSPDKVQEYLKTSEEFVQIACYNSPDSITLSGTLSELEVVKARLQEDGHFARMLQVNLAYHSRYMAEIGDHYETLLRQSCEPPLAGHDDVIMFSSVTGRSMDGISTDIKYWKSNMVSPVRFEQACSEMISSREGANFLIELGPSGALAGPIAQIKKALPGGGTNIKYCAAAKRGPESVMSMFDVAGQLFIADGNVVMSEVNKDDSNFERPAVIIDLPNYVWNHSVKYWHESEASKDWRFRQFPHHDLLGSKILGTSWNAPSWKKTLNVVDVPWLKDHRMGHDIVFPAAGYISMAVEAVYQTSVNTLFSKDNKIPENYRFRIRNVKCPRALVLDENNEHKVMLALAPILGSKDAWYEFKVSSLADEIWNEHSTGLIRIELDMKDVPSQAALEPLKHTTPGHLWYKAMHDAGYNFGPHFQKHLEIESTAGQRHSRSLVSLVQPASAWDQSCYPMHPACIDGCFQSVAPSLWKGDRSNINSVLVPAIVDNIVIASRPALPEQGISITTSEYLGVGRKEDMKNYSSSGSVYDPTTGNLVFEITGLRYHRLETREDIHAAHIYTRLGWKPDITFLDEPQLCRLIMENSATSLDDEKNPSETLSKVINLVAHKKPNLKVMEINLDPKDTSSLWLQQDLADTSARGAAKKYHFIFNDAKALINAQEQHEEAGSAVFALLDLTKPELAPSETDFDFVIAKIPGLSEDITKQVVKNVRTLLAAGGLALFVEHTILSSDSDSEDNVIVSGDALGAFREISQLLSESGFGNTSKFAYDQRSSGITRSAYTATADAMDATTNHTSAREINLVHLTENTRLSSSIEETLKILGWQFVEHSYPFEKLEAKSTVLVLDELFSPVLTTANETQWQAIKHLVSTECKILWVTSGSQMDVINPSDALAHGFFRTIRAEEPALSVTTLDVASESGPATIEAIDKVLKFIELPKPKKQMESELVERNGIIHVSRVFADELINQAKLEDGRGGQPRIMDLHGCENCIRFRCERLGNIDSLQYGEVSAAPIPVKDNCVEVEIFAAGLNFKDVAVTMGIVPENEHLLGLEGSGAITRLGKNVNSLRVGQRVVVFEKGTFANRIQATTERVFPLPDSMTYEEAATLPAVYLTSMYSLFYLANLQKGQRVLIHSASGGIGIASIQLCQYMDAEVSSPSRGLLGLLKRSRKLTCRMFSRYLSLVVQTRSENF